MMSLEKIPLESNLIRVYNQILPYQIIQDNFTVSLSIFPVMLENSICLLMSD